MSKFHGDLEDLKAIVKKSSVAGLWNETGNAHSFRSNEGGVLLWYPNTGTLQCQGKPLAKTQIFALIEYIEASGSSESIPDTPQLASGQPRPVLFVVYGHDTTSRDQLELILTKIGVDHLILAKSNTQGLTIIEALEAHIGQKGTAHAGIILMTPDDMGYAQAKGPKTIRARARQNVVLELGMIMGKLGRSNTIIVVTGDIERPSDTDGILYLSYQNHVKEIVAKLSERLEKIGFEIDHKKVLAAVQ